MSNTPQVGPNREILDLDRVRALALQLGPILNGHDLGEVQATLVLAWLMSTGVLNEISDMDERMARAGAFIQKGTLALGREVDKVMNMTKREIEVMIGTAGDVPGQTRH